MLTFFRIGFGLICLIKSIDIAGRGADSIPAIAAVGLGAAWAVASVALILGRQVKMACSALIVFAVAIAFVSDFELYNQHLYLIASIAAAFVIGRDVPLLLKAQLTIAYGFAATTKLSEPFLSGSVLYASAIQRPAWDHLVGTIPPMWALVIVSIIAICTESFLAVAFWFPRTKWVALIVGTGFHVGMLLLMSASLPSLLRLAVFGGLMMVLYVPFFPRETEAVRRWFARRFPKVTSFDAMGGEEAALSGRH